MSSLLFILYFDLGIEPGFLDVRDLQFYVALLGERQLDLPACRSLEQALELTLPVEGGAGTHLHFLSGKALKIRLALEHAVEPGGGHLERVARRHHVLHIEEGLYPAAGAL